MATPLDRLLDLPRAGLVAAPSPLHRADRLSRAVGADIWLKRDDVGPVALAGNKVRKYDLVLGQALLDGAQTLVTCGAVQSNSARAGAAAAALTGLECRLLLSGPEPAAATGNLLLARMLGADISFLGDTTWVDLEAQTVAEAERIPRSVLAPVGCSTPLGSLGFALAFLELQDQLAATGVQPAAVVHASSSLGTHAGLLVGRALTGSCSRIIGIDVAAIHPRPDEAANSLATAAAALIGFDLPHPGADIRGGFLGPGYGRPDAVAAGAIDLLARTEAVICDPVYSGKGAAGMLRVCGEASGPVLFWHTGGYHALFDPAHAAFLDHRVPDGLGLPDLPGAGEPSALFGDNPRAP